MSYTTEEQWAYNRGQDAGYEEAQKELIGLIRFQIASIDVRLSHSEMNGLQLIKLSLEARKSALLDLLDTIQARKPKTEVSHVA